jgi:hypothetical protein
VAAPRRVLSRVLLAVALGLGVLAAPAAEAAPAGGSASVSDTTPLPGQTVTVQASGLKPGGLSFVDYLPDGVRLAEVTVGDDGGYTVDVTIPVMSHDGPKQIVVTALDADGRYAYLPTDMTVNGPPATADLSDSTLVPGQTFQIDGSRFRAGKAGVVILYPEGVILAEPVPDAEGRWSEQVQVPAQVLNGRHGIAVVGIAAGGKVAYVKLFATITGGIGFVPEGIDLFAFPLPPVDGTTTVPSTSTSTTRGTTTTTRPRQEAATDGSDDDSSLWLLVLLAGCVLLLVIVAIAWLRTPEGRALFDREARRRRRGPPVW